MTLPTRGPKRSLRNVYHHGKRIIERAVTTPVLTRYARLYPADVAFFFNFQPPPFGGGNQFLSALWRNLEKRGLKLENNRISPTTWACLFNSHNFKVERLRRMLRVDCRLVHRVDGPIGLYRGETDAIDQHILALNQEFADCTIFQSEFSLAQHIEFGMHFNSPHVILNAADPEIFHPQGRIQFRQDRKIRLISSSWSDNPRKGTPVYKWLEDHIDWNRYEYTFVGRSQIEFEHIRKLAAVPSNELARILREHDIYITASQHDPCSNALIEALSCGLPALYLQSGGHPEIVGNAGFGFTDKEEIPALLTRLVQEYETRQAQINLPTLDEVADRYLEVMGVS